MMRRDFFKTSMAAVALTRGGRRMTAAESLSPSQSRALAKAPGLTKYVADFIASATYADIPDDVLVLGKKSILDGFGLSLAGSVSVMAPLVRRYIQRLGFAGAKASVIGTSLKAPARFAAFANGVFIHADDFDDTQLSAAPDRIYGLLTHPTAPVLPPAFALAELGHRSGKDLLLAYHVRRPERVLGRRGPAS